ncbi:MAG TPA: hypothetical protein GXZ28_02445 [Clostridiales bacterium]|jgi:hypothetical protein|nr:hypothetical protein [Clostridiales bacterium]
MKTYTKPTIEMIELRPEERLATCGTDIKGSNIIIIFLAWLLGFSTRCKIVSVGGNVCS